MRAAAKQIASVPQIMQSRLEQFFSVENKLGADGKMYRPADTSLRLWEALELRRLVDETQILETLEIGLALGASAVAIAEGLEQKGAMSRHVALDPYQANFGDVGLRELERLGLRHRVEFMALFSHDFLHDCMKQGRNFDLIFNDGAHSIGNKVADAFLSDQCLRPGGILAFHDAFMFSVVASVRFLIQERGYTVVSLTPESQIKRWLRSIKYGAVHGRWYGVQVVPRTAMSLVALRKPSINTR